jgi:hypothetical protein
MWQVRPAADLGCSKRNVILMAFTRGQQNGGTRLRNQMRNDIWLKTGFLKGKPQGIRIIRKSFCLHDHLP